MDKGVHELRRDYWRQVIRECNTRGHGITKREWFQEHNINSKSYYYWQKQFRSEAIATINTDADIQGTGVSTSVPKAGFFDITAAVHTSAAGISDVTADPVQSTMSNVPELMIQISDCRIFVNSTIQEKTLETVLKVIRHA